MYCDDILETIDSELLETIDNELKSTSSTHLLSWSWSGIAMMRLQVFQKTLTAPIPDHTGNNWLKKQKANLGDIWKDNGHFCHFPKTN